MGVTYGFYNSIDGDRKYNATHFNTLFDGIITDGIFSTWGDQFQVVPTDVIGKSCRVKTGKAWLDNTWTINDTIITFSSEIPEITVGTGRKRIDMVCIKVDKENRANSIEYVVGTESISPSKPPLTNGLYPLAYIYVSEVDNTYITATNIENVVGKSRTNGGTPLVTGLLQQMTVEQLTAAWESSFEAWFDEMKNQLSEDAAGNLQNEIDDLIKYGSLPLSSSSSLGEGKVYFQYEE